MILDIDGLPIVPGQLEYNNLKDVIEHRCKYQADKIAINFLHSGELDSQESMTFGELDTLSRSILSTLRGFVARGDRVVLLLPPGNQFVAAFVACLYGGIIAVPAAVPSRRDRDWERVLAILIDCEPKVVLSSGQHFVRISGNIKDTFSHWSGTVIDVDDIRSAQDATILTDDINGEDLAFLQYTSGSTGNPKGVMVSHDNLFHNSKLIQAAYGDYDECRIVSWLPLFHDLGLIGFTLQSLYAGAQLNYMAPAAFLQRPLRWIEAISHFRATHSGAPNSAYELCADRYDPDSFSDLDLSQWVRAYNGAEPVRHSTLIKFHKLFERNGFKYDALCPVYGLAEAVLMVAGRSERLRPKTLDIRSEEYSSGLIVPTTNNQSGISLVGVGGILGNQSAIIVNPQTLTIAEPDHIGELWLSGPSMTKGYWQNEAATLECFGARVDPNGADYLRTGDLAYIDKQGEIYITGRIKDTIILNGKNYFPQDIELVVEAIDVAFRLGGCATFSIEHGGQEKVVILQEVQSYQKDEDAKALIKAVRAKIATEFELNIFDVCLIRKATLLKTTSGKVQRQRNKQAYMNGELNLVAQHRSQPPEQQKVAALTSIGLTQIVLDWIKALPHAAPEIGLNDLFIDSGMDSLDAVGLAEHLSVQTGQSVDVTLIWSYPEIHQFCEELSRQIGSENIALRQATALVNSNINIDEMNDDEFHELLRKELS